MWDLRVPEGIRLGAGSETDIARLFVYANLEELSDFALPYGVTRDLSGWWCMAGQQSS